MGNPLKKIEPWIDPVGNAATKALGIQNGLGAQPGAAPPGFNPNAAPGTHLTPAPAGGPPAGTGIFSPNAGQAPPGYAPNPAQAAAMGQGGGYSPPPGGAPPGGAPALQQQTGGMNPQLQRQMMIAQQLRGGAGGGAPITSMGGGGY
jgi:hypothetical protein